MKDIDYGDDKQTGFSGPSDLVGGQASRRITAQECVLDPCQADSNSKWSELGARNSNGRTAWGVIRIAKRRN